MPAKEVFSERRLATPNYSGRMDNLRAAILRVQLRSLDENCHRWNELYAVIEQGLRSLAGISLPFRPAYEEFVGSSVQFSLPGWRPQKISSFITECSTRGVDIKWFGDNVPRGYTSRFESWHYLSDQGDLGQTSTILDGLCDLRIPLTFDRKDCQQIVAVITEALLCTEAAHPCL